tara:strand:+ start:907 stop:1449 length:543 start_codon:yes stop_codon:yes gene_type:complete
MPYCHRRDAQGFFSANDELLGRDDDRLAHLMITVRRITAEHRADWLRMRCELWPDDSATAHAQEIDSYFAGDFPRGAWVTLLAVDTTGRTLGFAEASTRSHAEGCESTNVGYLEGWFVAASARQRGVGRALVQAAENWARERGCTEFASDAEPDNQASCSAHLALGFENAGLVRCFRKAL